ncbi:MAG: aldose epimerase family protein [Pirellulales bacterium]
MSRSSVAVLFRGPRRAAGRLQPWAVRSGLRWLAALAALATFGLPSPGYSQTKDSPKMSIDKADFGQTADGDKVSVYTMTNANGMVVRMVDYGATIIGVEVPDRKGKLANVTLGFPKLDGYLQRHPYFGSTVGRYCNRIAKGQFSLGGKSYSLAINNAPNTLHGGEKGFDRQMWKAEPKATADAVSLRFTRRSPDGEEGYPGNVDVVATYSLNNKNELTMEFEATADQPTVVNLTNHAYWNLAGAGSGTIENHELTLTADKYLAVDATLIPTGEMPDVAGTPLDFRQAKKIGADLKKIPDVGGYDHCYVLRNQSGQLALAARVKDPASGRVMEILTTQPGIQFYTGNFLDGKPANGGYPLHGALCLETQHYPDSPNHPEFPSTVLKPGEKFRQVTVHRFSVE